MIRPSLIRLPVVLLSAGFLLACGDSSGPDPNAVATVTIEPDDPALLVGDDVQLTATARNRAGDALSGKSASWSSSAPAVASVTSGGGLLTGVSAGTAQITATIEGKSATVTATVSASGVAPMITGVSPSPLVPGSGATLTGTDLTATTQVWVNGVRAVVSAASAAGVQFTVPCVAPGAGVVVARNGSASSADFAATVNATPSAAMAVGDFQTLSGQPCLQLGASASQMYLIGLQSVSEDVSSLTALTFNIDVSAGAAAATLAEAPAVHRTGSAFGAVPPVLIGDADQARWQAHRRAEHALRVRDMEATAPLLAAGRRAPSGATATYSTLAAAAVPSVGDTVRMRYPNPDGNLCTDYVPVTGVVRHVSARGIFVADTANPASGFTTADYQRFGAVLDDSIYEPQATYFGTPTDLDSNQRIIVLLTKEVNEREGILGMVVSADLFPRSTCPASDEGEIYYGRVPDPTGAVGAAYTVEAARLDVPALIAHEMTHIIQFGRRATANVQGVTWQALWEMESQATLAEEVIGHRFTARQTGQNYGFDVAWENCSSTSTGIAWYCDKFQDLALYYGFLSQTSRAQGAPEQCSWLGRQDQGNTGPCIHQRMVYTGWSFLRWLSDHYGPALGGEAQIHRQLIDNYTRNGFASIVSIIGQPIDQLLGRWAATLYADDRFTGVGGQLTLPSWNLYDVEQRLNTNARLQPYPHAFTDAARNVSVRGGSSAYFLVSGARAQSAIGMTTQSGATLPSYMRLWVVRVQ